MFTVLIAKGQHDEHAVITLYGYTKFQTSLETDTIDYLIYGSDSTLKIKKPLLLFIQGSQPIPLFPKANGGYAPPLPFNPKKIAEFHIAVISKTGLPIVPDTMFQFPVYLEVETKMPPQMYTLNNSLAHRVQTANQVIKDILTKDFIDKSRVVVVGHSEGARVASKLATANTHITELGFFSGSATNQFYDLIIGYRKAAASGEISNEQSQILVDSLLTQYKSIIANPTSTEDFWWGSDTYLRWSSFSQEVISDLLKLSIPIYLTKGMRDKNSQIESTDVVAVEFISNKKDNLTYKVYPEYDHNFFEYEKVNGIRKRIKHWDDVMIDFIKWIEL